MTRSVAVLDFFLVEASEYVERLDLLLRSAGPQGPNVDALVRDARALRGSATMFRQESVARLAHAMERAGRALRDGALPWSPALMSTFTATIDDLRVVLRNAREWSAADEQRVRTRAEELELLTPSDRATPTSLREEMGASFVSSAAGALASVLERLVEQPANPMLIAEVQQRVRALHGVAFIKDAAPLPDVADAIERVLVQPEQGNAPTGTELELLAAATAVLRRIAADLAEGKLPSRSSREAARFDHTLALVSAGGQAEQVVPITQLFYDDQGPHVVNSAANPPTSPAERFRLEVVSRAEHVRRVVGEARGARDAASRDRVARELKTAVHALGSAAQSFGEHKVAKFIDGWGDRIVALDAKALSALESAAAMLSEPAVPDDEVRRRLEQLTPRAGDAVPAPHTTRSPTPTGRDLYDFLENGIAGINRLSEHPLLAPVPLPDEDVVPIDRLLYRGRAALDRAIELRDQIRDRGGAPPRAEIEEIFDLLDLAVGE